VSLKYGLCCAATANQHRKATRRPDHATADETTRGLSGMGGFLRVWGVLGELLGFLRCSGASSAPWTACDSAASGLFAFGGVLPCVLAVQSRELQELLAQGLILLPPSVTALLDFLRG
jgi:hypothetical protein